MHMDIVCGMEVSATEISFLLEGRNFYFCSEGCRAEFVRHADDYVPAATKGTEDAEPLSNNDV